MKKMLILILFLLVPFNVFAYSEYIIPGGETIGININDDGVIVIGFYKVNNEYINDFLEPGDKIIKVNGISVGSVEELSKVIEENIDSDYKVNISFVRDNNEIDDTLELKLIDGVFKSGLYIKSNVVGIGTLTYIDENIYGALGHVVNYGTINKRVEIKDGTAFFSDVTNFIRSKNGNPGSKSADIIYDKRFGTVSLNSNYGIYGFTAELNNKENRARFNSGMFFGNETDPDMLRIGTMNMTLHDVSDPQIFYKNSLTDDNKDINIEFSIIDN